MSFHAVVAEHINDLHISLDVKFIRKVHISTMNEGPEFIFD